MKTPAAFGKQSEECTTLRLNEYFARQNLPWTATTKGGSSHVSDIRVEDRDTGEKLYSMEDKNSFGTRTDYGQFRISYDPEKGWQQATGRDKLELVTVFAFLKPRLDKQLRGNFPHGPRISALEAQEFWDVYEPGRTRSISGDVLKIPIAPEVIASYYANKGDKYIKIGEHVYGLEEGELLPSLAGLIKEAYALFRIKYHNKRTHNSHSYTVALRLKCDSTDETAFNEAIKKIHPSRLTSLS